MTKQELAHIAKVMYDLQEYCRYTWDDVDDISLGCPNCVANKGGVCELFVACHGTPIMWCITQADIERLERESNDD